MTRALAILAAGLVLAACGAPSADLFEVEVSGADTNANYTLLVSDDGRVRCNGGEPQRIGEDRLIDAREVARELAPQAELSIDLPEEGNSILRYQARLRAGTVEFSDTSAGRPKSFNLLMAFSTDVAENVCGLER